MSILGPLMRPRLAPAPILQFARGIRTKNRTFDDDEDYRRASIWHNRLQRQALKLKERLKKEGKLDFQKTDPYFTDENLLDSQEVYFWKKFVTPEESKALAPFGIKTMDELYDAVKESRIAEGNPTTVKEEDWPKHVLVADVFENSKERLFAEHANNLKATEKRQQDLKDLNEEVTAGAPRNYTSFVKKYGKPTKS